MTVAFLGRLYTAICLLFVFAISKTAYQFCLLLGLTLYLRSCYLFLSNQARYGFGLFLDTNNHVSITRCKHCQPYRLHCF